MHVTQSSEALYGVKKPCYERAVVRKFKLFTFIITGLIVSGCVTMSAMNVPGQTSANLQLKADIINMINILERAQGCSYEIADTKFVKTEGGTVYEDWVVHSCGKDVVYEVKLTPDPGGGTMFGVRSPKKR